MIRNIHKLLISKNWALIAVFLATISLILPIAINISEKNKQSINSKNYIEKIHEQNTKLDVQIELLSKKVNLLEKEIESNKIIMKSLDNNLSFQTEVIKNLLNTKGENK